MSRRSESDDIPTGLAVIYIIFWCALNAWLWPYIGNTWLEYSGKAPQIVWWQGALIGFVPYLNKFVIPIAVVTWFLMLVLK